MDSEVLCKHGNRNVIIVWIKIRHDTVSEIILLTIIFKRADKAFSLYIRIICNIDCWLEHFLGKLQNRSHPFTCFLNLLPGAASGLIKPFLVIPLMQGLNAAYHSCNHRLCSFQKVINPLIFKIYNLSNFICHFTFLLMVLILKSRFLF